MSRLRPRAIRLPFRPHSARNSGYGRESHPSGDVSMATDTNYKLRMMNLKASYIRKNIPEKECAYLNGEVGVGWPVQHLTSRSP